LNKEGLKNQGNYPTKEERQEKAGFPGGSSKDNFSSALGPKLKG